jgi:hypothetical protein
MATILSMAAAALATAFCYQAAKRWQDAQAKMTRLRIQRQQELQSRSRRPR